MAMMDWKLVRQKRTKVCFVQKQEVVSKRWHNLFFTFYSPAIFSFAYDAFF